MRCQRDSGVHSEIGIIDKLEKKVFSAKQIEELYTERQPCPLAPLNWRVSS
ncbi:nucleic acid/nucleotide deaminase domain-containing protein [Streptomyces sp. SGAir0957]